MKRGGGGGTVVAVVSHPKRSYKLRKDVKRDAQVEHYCILYILVDEFFYRFRRGHLTKSQVKSSNPKSDPFCERACRCMRIKVYISKKFQVT